jgi:peptidoglycan/xylan/chitin deacetylase (PgdA/CDA1 family)
VSAAAAAVLPILTFHALDHATDVCGLAPAVFRDGLGRLHAAGFRTVVLAEAVAALAAGVAPTARTFALTFDDGYRSVHTEAFPVLQRYGMTATVFLTVGAGGGDDDDRLPSLGGREMLGWHEIRELHRAGIAFGAHSLTHADLTTLADARLEAEVREPRRRIEERIGAPAPGFAYPFGRFDARVCGVVRRHYDFACADTLGLAGLASDVWALERVETFYFRGRHRVALLASPWLPMLLRMIAIPRTLRRQRAARASAGARRPSA